MTLNRWWGSSPGAFRNEENRFIAITSRFTLTFCNIIKELFFYFNHFSLIIFYHSVWLGFELFGLRVRVYSIWYSLRSRAKDMTMMIVIINPKQEMGLECGWRHALKRWAENLRILKNTGVEGWHWTKQAESWVLCHWVAVETGPLKMYLFLFISTNRCAARLWDHIVWSA